MYIPVEVLQITTQEAFDILFDKIKLKENFEAALVAAACEKLSVEEFSRIDSWILKKGYDHRIINRIPFYIYES